MLQDVKKPAMNLIMRVYLVSPMPAQADNY